MANFNPILDGLREFWLNCIGSPDSRSRQLSALRGLDAHLLNDIGLTPEEARGANVLQAPPPPRARLPLGQPSLNR